MFQNLEVFIGFDTQKQYSQAFYLFDLTKPKVFLSFETQKQYSQAFWFDLPKLRTERSSMGPSQSLNTGLRMRKNPNPSLSMNGWRSALSCQTIRRPWKPSVLTPMRSTFPLWRLWLRWLQGFQPLGANVSRTRQARRHSVGVHLRISGRKTSLSLLRKWSIFIRFESQKQYCQSV